MLHFNNKILYLISDYKRNRQNCLAKFPFYFDESKELNLYDKSLPKHDSTLQHTVFLHTVSAETIQGTKLFKGGTYMRKYGILILFGPTPFVQALSC